MKEWFILMWKGFVIGLGKILPGVSGGMLAISMGLYEKIIYSVGYLFRDFRRNCQFLLVLGIGALIAIAGASKVIELSLSYFYIPTMLLFIGLIMGGIPGIVSRVGCWHARHYLLGIGMFGFILLLTFFGGRGEDLIFDDGVLSFFVLIGIGFIDAATMIVPGVSGTAIMMMIGFYPTFLSCLSTVFNINLLSYNMMILIPFGIGILIGVLLISRIVAYFFRHYESETYASITGFAVASIVCLFVQTFSVSINCSLLLGFVLLLLGYCLGRILDK